MAWMKRISLFILTNILVVVTISLVFSLLSNFLGIRAGAEGYSSLILFCSVWGMGGAFISLLMSKFMAKMAMGVEIIDPATRDPHLRSLVETVHELARKAQLPKMPEVGIFDNPELNAFATGPSKSNSLVAVSTGLLNRMSQDEVEGVLGHEIAHIANGDMVTMTLIQGIVNAFVMFFARIIGGIISSQVEEKSRFWVRMLVVMVLEILFSILGSIVVNAFSKRREYRADFGGASLTSKHKMIGALRRLQANYESLESDQSGLATLKISSKSEGWKSLFSTHPSLEDRIRTLEQTSLH
jgi:heat shock protein HtpX